MDLLYPKIGRRYSTKRSASNQRNDRELLSVLYISHDSSLNVSTSRLHHPKKYNQVQIRCQGEIILPQPAATSKIYYLLHLLLCLDSFNFGH